MADENTNPYSAPQGAGAADVVIQLRGIVQQLSAFVAAIKAVFPSGTGTSATATGGAATLPANPVGFINVTLPNGAQGKVPYYT
jgi:hypothetical protein